MHHLKQRRELRRFRETYPTRREWDNFVQVRRIKEVEIYALKNWAYLAPNRPWAKRYGKLRSKAETIDPQTRERIAQTWWGELSAAEKTWSLTQADAYMRTGSANWRDAYELWRGGLVRPYLT